MRLLADENCDRLLVAMLRDAGHDVAYALERWRGADDITLNRIAREQNRVVLTDDLDFGELALNRKEMIRRSSSYAFIHCRGWFVSIAWFRASVNWVTSLEGS